ncbi:MAG TPA: DUF4150 domain-containing protein [Chitinispirillaceae bacterium]|nr:DUF4150 domain-containing protein [Chitinispirillaceae bacterium]
MPSTVIVNKMTAVHKGSAGICQCFPDVCKTPSAPSPIPVPYPNIAMSSNAADTAPTVSADGNPIMLNTSKFAMSTGDEAGSLMGVVSNKVKGSANPQSWSMDVKADGKNVFRQLDLMLNNGGSKPTNTAPGPNNQPPNPALPPKEDPEKMKITKVQWEKTKCKCGDVVKIQSGTQNYPAGSSITHRIRKKGEKNILETVSGNVKGDAVEIEWITKNGYWTKNPTILNVKAYGGSGSSGSSNELQIEKPAEFFQRVFISAPDNIVDGLTVANVPKKVPQKVPLITIFGISIGSKIVNKIVNVKQVVPSGKKWAWDYGYDLELKKGRFQITCKVKLTPRDDPGAGTKINLKGKRLTKAKAKWKKEIEDTWSRKWKEHREACKRGDACNCPGGCCIFPIHVKCRFVSSGEHVNVNLWPGAPKLSSHVASGSLVNPDWWDSADWYEKLSGREGNGAKVHAHEFGHTIGMGDEYTAGAVIAQYMNVAGSIMQSGNDVMKQHFEIHPAKASSGKSKSIHQRFKEAVKDNGYKLIPV